MKRGALFAAAMFVTLAATVSTQTLPVPTTLDDFFLAGSQPTQSGQLETPDKCDNCHGGYDQAVEPAFNWRGGMMAHAARDPFFYACMTVANQDAAFAGDLCIRCHSPAGWLEGRSTPTDGSALNANDRQGVQCDFCHKLVDPRVSSSATNIYSSDNAYMTGTNPRDLTYLGTLSVVPAHNANGMYVADSDNGKRGPRSTSAARHQFWYSPFHSASAICGTCHDVSNPVFTRTTGTDSYGNPVYGLDALNTANSSMSPRDQFPVERTFSEWTQSAFANPQNEDPVVNCQDCHMPQVEGVAANKRGITNSTVALHDLTGGNTWVPDMVAMFYPNEVDQAALTAGKQRAANMLQNAATLTASIVGTNLVVRVQNETGHKLPSGYPEGRRIWLNIQLSNSSGPVQEINAYDAANATFVSSTKVDAMIFEVKLAMSSAVQSASGLTNDNDGTRDFSFHFALNNVVTKDNRIPPRGYSLSNFKMIQSPPVPHNLYTTAGGQDVSYFESSIPMGDATEYTVNLYYQTASKDYVEFLKNENRTNTWGTDLHNAWAATGKSAPVLMETVSSTPAGGVNPTAPLSLTETGSNFNQVSMQWLAPATGTADSYTVYRDGSAIATGVTTTTYADGGVQPSTTYQYSVTAVKGSYESSASNTITVTTPAKKGGKKTPKAVRQDQAQPADFALFPNVANTEATLQWHMDSDAEVSISLYALDGRELSHLPLGATPAGHWSYRLALGQLPPGTYFVRLEKHRDGDIATAVRKLLIVR